MLWFVSGFSTTYRKFKMSVQMIELEAVTMMEASDEALEAVVAEVRILAFVWTSTGC
jgi:hypothetical protein